MNKMLASLALCFALNGCVSTLEYEGFRRVAFYQFGNEALEISRDRENVKLKYAAKKEPAWLGLEAALAAAVGFVAAGI